MGKRRKARELALMVLYELDFRPTDLGLVLREFWRDRVVPPEVQRVCRGAGARNRREDGGA